MAQGVSVKFFPFMHSNEKHLAACICNKMENKTKKNHAFDANEKMRKKKKNNCMAFGII